MSNEMKRVHFTYHEDENFKVILEDIDGYLFIHVEVFNYNKTVKQRMMLMWEDVKNWADVTHYDGINCYTPNPKFVKLLGGECEVLRTIQSGDDTYEVLRWELK